MLSIQPFILGERVSTHVSARNQSCLVSVKRGQAARAARIATQPQRNGSNHIVPPNLTQGRTCAGSVNCPSRPYNRPAQRYGRAIIGNNPILACLGRRRPSRSRAVDAPGLSHAHLQATALVHEAYPETGRYQQRRLATSRALLCGIGPDHAAHSARFNVALLTEGGGAYAPRCAPPKNVAEFSECTARRMRLTST